MTNILTTPEWHEARKRAAAGKPPRKPRKPRRAKAAEAAGDGTYVRGPWSPNFPREPGHEINDIAADLSRLRSLLRVVEHGIEGLPCDILTGHMTMTSGQVGELATLAVGHLDRIIAATEKLTT